MGLFSRIKTVDPQQAPAHAGKKIILNFGGRASKTVLDIAAATLEAGGYIQPSPREREVGYTECPPREPEIGDQMPDGTLYAGVSPDTGKAMYATPADAPLAYAFNEARQYAEKLDACGHQDWRVPTKDELNVLFNNRAAIGRFNVTGLYPAGWYWSSSQNSEWGASCQLFSDGDRGDYYKNNHLSVRCVR
jgi:hypothetical protein